MNYLVATKILLWAFIEPKRLSSGITKILSDNENTIYYSPVSLWEISEKYRSKKLQLKGISPEGFFKELSNSFFRCLEINPETLTTCHKLPALYGDHFTGFLVWEAIRSDFVLLSADPKLKVYRNEGLHIVINGTADNAMALLHEAMAQQF